MPRHPVVYANLLKDRLEKHPARIWLVNTGWTGGPYGVGKRMHLPFTRAMISAALNNKLDHVSFNKTHAFNLLVPESCPDVPDSLLEPRSTWQDIHAYDQAAASLVNKFQENFAQYAGQVPLQVMQAGLGEKK